MDKGFPAGLIELDLTQRASIAKAVGNILATESRIDVVVNNTDFARGSTVEETDFNAVRKLFETIFFGAARTKTPTDCFHYTYRGEPTYPNIHTQS